MKLRADIAGKSYSVDSRRYGSRVVTEIDDRRYELYIHESGLQEFLLIHDGRVFDCRVEGRPESGKTIDVIVGVTSYAIALTDPKRFKSSGHAHDRSCAPCRAHARQGRAHLGRGGRTNRRRLRHHGSRSDEDAERNEIAQSRSRGGVECSSRRNGEPRRRARGGRVKDLNCKLKIEK